MHPLFRIASMWESSGDDVREPLRNVVSEIVGYPCKLACIATRGSINILVVCADNTSRDVKDWLELQPIGAFGVLFDQYTDDDDNVDAVSNRCEIYNNRNHVEFCSGSESTSDTDSDTNSCSDPE